MKMQIESTLYQKKLFKSLAENVFQAACVMR